MINKINLVYQKPAQLFEEKDLIILSNDCYNYTYPWYLMLILMYSDTLLTKYFHIYIVMHISCYRLSDASQICFIFSHSRRNFLGIYLSPQDTFMHSTVFTFGFFLCYTLGTRVLFDCICILLNDSSLLYPSYILSLSLLSSCTTESICCIC